jgi:CDP-4-dehydro-6-deoxyglucose reductase, E3
MPPGHRAERQEVTVKLTGYESVNCPHRCLASPRPDPPAAAEAAEVEGRAVVHDPIVPPSGLRATREFAPINRELTKTHGRLKPGEAYPASLVARPGRSRSRQRRTGVPAPVEDAKFTVAAKRQRTPVIAELLLRPAGAPLRYQAGQYVLLGDPGAELLARSYSIANAPRRDGLISLLVTRIPGGQVSAWVHDVLNPGDRVLLSGPYGSFTAAPGEPGPVLFLAGGSGLAPVRALAEGALRRRISARVVLFFSARTEGDVIDEQRFRSWQRRHPRFCYLRTLTRAGGPPPTGRLPDILGDWYPDLSGWRTYIAGAPGFVAACAAAARACGARPGGCSPRSSSPTRSRGEPPTLP